MTEPDEQAQTSRVLSEEERAERALRNRAWPLPGAGRRPPRVPVLPTPPDPRKA